MKRSVLITGVSGGIGSATAHIFSEAGWRVIGVDLQPTGAVKGVDHFIQGDISDVEDAERIFAEVAGREKNLDALVNNAAVQVCRSLVETAPEEWDMVMESNVRSVYLAVRQSYPLMRSGGGAIVNVGSVHAHATSGGVAAYAASKGAVSALTRALAIELACDKIRVNAVLPGATDTAMLRAGLNRGQTADLDSNELMEKLGARHLFGRIGRPEEIAEAILFLADGDRSSFVTGQELIVDGGATARLSTE